MTASKCRWSFATASIICRSTACNRSKSTRRKASRRECNISRSATTIANLMAKNSTFRRPALCWNYIYKNFPSRSWRPSCCLDLKRPQHCRKWLSKRKNSSRSSISCRTAIKSFWLGSLVTSQPSSITRSTTSWTLKALRCCCRRSCKCLIDWWSPSWCTPKRSSLTLSFTSKYRQQRPYLITTASNFHCLPSCSRR